MANNSCECTEGNKLSEEEIQELYVLLVKEVLNKVFRNSTQLVKDFVAAATVTEGGKLEFMVAITDRLKYDLTVDVGSYFNGSADESDLSSAYSGTVTILAGELNKSFTPAIDTKTNDGVEGTETFIFAATGYRYAGEGKDDNDLGSLLIMNAGEGTILDGDEEPNNPTKKDVEIYVGDATVTEGGTLEFTVGIDNTLDKDFANSNIKCNFLKM